MSSVVKYSIERAETLRLISISPKNSCCLVQIGFFKLIVGAIPLFNLFALKSLISNCYYYRKFSMESTIPDVAILYKAAFYSTLIDIITVACTALGTTLFIVAACHQGLMADHLNYAGVASLGLGICSNIINSYYYTWSPRPELMQAAGRLIASEANVS